MSKLTKWRTYAQLGVSSIARVGLYRLGLKAGVHPAMKLQATVAAGPFFRASARVAPVPPANAAWDDALWWFGWHRQPLPASPPNWFTNPFSELPQPDTSRDWWRIPDFGTGDIKGLWELSRFDWVVAWATRAAQRDAEALDRLNYWLADWAQQNPPYKGPNWKCGQEASIRAMHLIAAAWLLGQDQNPAPGLVDILRTHLQRIAPTMSYAIGQQNNHGTSEAAALFIGGIFLSRHDPRADGWARKGRRWLEERAQTLIEPDGSFSQYSVTYHRVMLDSYSFAEAWRRHRKLPAFSDRLRTRLGAASRWLATMTDPVNGDAPNIGGNDGARLLQFTGGDYRDFRPSVQLAAALFEGRDAFGEGPWSVPLQWLDVREGIPSGIPESASFNDGGYHVLRSGGTWAVLRFPRFRFRPSQADALHVDLWHNGVNLLRDAGTFSYNADGAGWFGGTAAHNTVEFDGRDQMPRLGRFLRGDWLKTETVEPVRQQGDEVTASASYTDGQGARHSRRLTIGPGRLVCHDTISGSFEAASLRWRLAPGDWHVEGTHLRHGNVSLSVEVDGKPVTSLLGTAPESRYFQQRSEVPLAMVDVDRPATLITKVSF
jgi:hypothetical protein